MINNRYRQKFSFGSSGIREIVTAEFIEAAYHLGLSLSSGYHRLIVGGDTRVSTPAMKYALFSGLLAGGGEVQDAGVIPTPTLAFAARHFQAGVMITASHNPPEYNGIKLWNADGSAFNETQRELLESQIAAPYKYPDISRNQMSDVQANPSAINDHVTRTLSDFPDSLNLKVVVDAGGGATSLVTPNLLRQMGCQVISLNCHPTGFFPRPSEPSPENLATLIQAVKTTGADLGLAHDGDGDRLVAVDDMGRVVPGDKLLILIANSLNARKVITTVDASMIVEEAGFQVLRTRVGDAFVSQEIKNGGDFGGEAAGAWIFPQVSLCPDGIYAAAVVAHIVSKERLSVLVDAIPSYPILRASIPTDKQIMARIEEEFMRLQPLSVTRLDGLRLDMGDGWLLVRPSGTEPKLRLTVEAREQKRAEELFNSGKAVIQACQKRSNAIVEGL
ncbi:MAG: glmM [Dehalococcoidia bacterium]|nr:glmM [Dehalococcoidia bacterium]MBF8303859.1 glmM [Dehalococcoidia bacterium]